MSSPDQEVLKNPKVMDVIEGMFTEAFRNGSQGVAYEISKLLVKDWGFDIKNIQVPITFWQGEQDNNVPAQWAEMMARQIDGAALNTFPSEGHLIIFEHAPEIFSELTQA